MKSKVACVLIAVGVSCTPGFASVVETDAVSNTGFTVPNVNLLQDAVATVNNPTYIQPEEGVSTANLGILTDLSFGDPGLDNASQVVTVSSGAVITYAFSAPVTITSLNTYAGWRDSGRANQDYTVNYALADDPSLFLTLDSVAYHPSFGLTPVDTYVSLKSSSGPLLSDVVAIQFAFPSVENGYVGYRELNVLGSLSVPEPGTLAMAALAFGAAAMSGWRGRRRTRG
jgi:hypothetical protein